MPFRPITNSPFRLITGGPATVNLVNPSSDFAHPSWSKVRVDLVGGQAAPDGTLTATRVTRNSTTLTAFMHDAIASGPVVTTYTASVFAKAGSLDKYLGLRIQGNHPRMGNAVFDVGLGLVHKFGSSVTNTDTTATITPAGNGWFRCSVTTTFVLAENSALSLVLGPTNAATAFGGWEVLTPINDVIVWGAQLETGSLMTAYRAMP